MICRFNPLDDSIQRKVFLCPECKNIVVSDFRHPDYNNGEEVVFVNGKVFAIGISIENLAKEFGMEDILNE